MKTIAITAAPRAEYGKKATKAVRRQGLIPCVIYGGGENVSFAIDEKSVKPLIYTPNSYIVELDIDGQKELAVLRDVQYHPIREQILHIDFYRVQEGKPVSIAVPVRLTGTAEGVKVGGKMETYRDEVVLAAKPADMPRKLVLDVTGMEIGQTIRVSNMPLPEGVRPVYKSDFTMVSVFMEGATEAAE